MANAFIVAFAFKVFCQYVFLFWSEESRNRLPLLPHNFFLSFLPTVRKFKFPVVIRYIINYGSLAPFVVDLRSIRVRNEIIDN